MQRKTPTRNTAATDLRSISQRRRKTVCLLLAGCALVITANVWGESDPALPTVRGADAIEQLKQAGEYDSLASAVDAALQADGQLEELGAPDAFGQSTQLLAAGGGVDDLFGSSVAISGDTAVVGAFFDEVGANSDQGSASSVTTGIGSVSGNPTFAANTMTVNLTGVADVQRITVTLSGVTDSAGYSAA